MMAKVALAMSAAQNLLRYPKEAAKVPSDSLSIPYLSAFWAKMPPMSERSWRSMAEKR